jgi:plasmid stabilization system protein ParE
MDCKVLITDRAIEDLKELVAYIARDNPGAAERVGLALIEKFMGLSRHPWLGHVIPGQDDVRWRELAAPPYRLLCFVDEERRLVYAARVWHGARRALPGLTL